MMCSGGGSSRDIWEMVFTAAEICQEPKPSVPKDHINVRILHSGSEAQDKADFRNQFLYYPGMLYTIYSTIYHILYIIFYIFYTLYHINIPSLSLRD